MTYVNAPSEQIPFPDEYFDVVTSINSLDHVDDLHQTLQEIKRVLKRGGMFMLLVDIHPAPTIAEPITIDWSIIDALSPELQVIQVLQLEHDSQKRGSIAALRANVPFNHADTSQRYGTLFAKMIKPSA
jgi:ubiquinone/menaquinone biosynthesis C-methylase UbiE